MPLNPREPDSERALERRRVLQGVLAASLPVSLLSCAAKEQHKALIVGGLPVTCNLALPVACIARATANRAGPGGTPQFAYEYSKYSGWPEIKESLMAGRIQAAYMLAPLVMDLPGKKIPIKIVSLGARSGAVVMVPADSPHQDFRELKGKRNALPRRVPAAVW